MNPPKSFYVYEFSYPEEMLEYKGAIFYVGKGTHAMRMDAHFKEAENGCVCKKCEAIRSIWDTGLIVVRRIVFESMSETEALNEESRRIIQHQSPFLTNIQGIIRKQASGSLVVKEIEDPLGNDAASVHPFQASKLPLRITTPYESHLVDLIFPPDNTLPPRVVETMHDNDGNLVSIQIRKFQLGEKLSFAYTMTQEDYKNRGF